MATSQHSPGLVDRSKEAESISHLLLSTESKVTVLFGDHGSGKTTFVRQWLMPILGRERPVFFGSIEKGLPETVENHSETVAFRDAISQPGIVILDDFENLFIPNKADGIELLRKFLAQRTQTRDQALIVFIVDADHLSKIYELARFAPEILDAMWEIDTVDVVKGFHARIARGQSGAGEKPASRLALHMSEELRELDENIGPLSPALLEVLSNEYERVEKKISAGSGLETYLDECGDIGGLLRAYVDRCLNEVFSEGQQEQKEIAYWLLEYLALNQHKGIERNRVLLQMSQRLAITSGRVETVLNQLEQCALVEEQDSGDLELNPGELSWVLQPSGSQSAEIDLAARLVEQGINAWQTTESLLPRVSFEEIHKQRVRLLLTQQQIEFLFRCALWNEDISQEVASYWCSRITDTEDRIDLLRGGVHDENGHVRAKSARLMSTVNRIDVRNELYLRTLKETDNNVRHAMIDGLAVMNLDGFKEVLKGDVLDSKSPYRSAAIDCLRIYKDPETLAMLHSLWANENEHPALRERAIRVLSAMGTKEAADELLELRLTSNDDRTRKVYADTAIAEISDNALLDRIVMNLMEPVRFLKERKSKTKLGKRKIWHFFLALVVVSLNIYLPGLALLTIRRWVIGGILLLLSAVTAYRIFVFETSNFINATDTYFSVDEYYMLWFLAICAGVLFPAASLLRERYKKLVHSSYRNILAFQLFLLSCVAFFLIHGLAHAFARRWKTAFVLLGLEIVGIAFLLIGWTHDGVIYRHELAKDLIAWTPLTSLWIGGILFVGTFIWDIVYVAVVDVLLARRFEVKRRAKVGLAFLAGKKEIADRFFTEIAEDVGDSVQLAKKKLFLQNYSQHLNAESVFVALTKENTRTLPSVFRSLQVNRASELLHLIEPAIGNLSQSTRDTIFKIITRHPTESGLDVLDKRANRMSWLERVKSWVARRRVELRPLSNSVVLTLVVGSPLLFLSYEGYRVLNDPDWAISKYVLRKEDANRDQRLEAAGYLARDGDYVAWLETVFEQTSDLALKSAIVSKLYEKQDILKPGGIETIMSGVVDAQNGYDRGYAIRALSTIINRDGFDSHRGFEELTGYFTELLQISPDIVIDYWAQVDERESAMRVVEFLANVIIDKDMVAYHQDLANGLTQIIKKQSAPSSGNTRIQEKKLANFQWRAFTKLVELPGSEHELRQISEDVHISPKIRRLAKGNLKADSQAELKEHLSRGEYRRVISRSSQLLEQNPEEAPRMKLLEIRAGAYTELAFDGIAPDPENLKKAIDDWIEYKQIGESGNMLNAESRIEVDRKIVNLRVERGDALFEKALLEEEPQRKEFSYKALDEVSRALEMARSYEGQLNEELAYASYIKANIQAYGIEDYESALLSLEKALELGLEYVGTYYLQSLIFQNQGLIEEALNAATKSIRLDPYSFQGYQLLHDAYLGEEVTRGKIDDAIEAFRELKLEYQGSYIPSFYLSVIYHENLALTDPAGYKLALQEIEELRKRKDFEELDVYLAPNWVEANFTNSRYDVVLNDGARYLQNSQMAPETRIGIQFFMYLANIAKGRVLAARDALTSIQQIVDVNQNTIDFSEATLFGTFNYIQSLKVLSDQEKKDIEALGQSLIGSKSEEINEAIERNFNVLDNRLKQKRFKPLG